MPRRHRRRWNMEQLKRDPNIKRGIQLLVGLGMHISQQVKQQTQQDKAAPISQETEPQPPALQLYSSTGEKTALGIVKIVAGSLFGSLTFLAAISALVMLIAGNDAIPLLASLALMGGSVGLFVSGIRTLNLVSRFKRYRGFLGQKTHCTLLQLARSVGKPEAFVRKDLKQMIEQGLFLEGHMDQDETTLITSHETYRHYEQSRLQFEQQQKLEAQEKAAAQQRAKEDQEKAQNLDPRVQAVLTQGRAFLLELRRCNDLIPGREISEKISRMELIIQKIFLRLEQDPEVVDDLKKMMDYYLPMTIKLLKTYADMDAQPIQGETITASKKEIEQTLDTLNLAFERLLDSIFQETAMDVSSDISVLQTLLAQEGLTEDPLEQIKKQMPHP